jgi:hypothetical protein
MSELVLSKNILRDRNEHGEDYITTSNAVRIYERIVSNFKSGQHSFSIIGSYGTGKSSFLLAFERHLLGVRQHFTPLNGEFKGIKQIKFHKLIGSPVSFKCALAESLGLSTTSNSSQILEKLDDMVKANESLVLLVDEFGKFLEHAAAHQPEEELYFIQELTEHFNAPARRWIFILSLHQNFNAYARKLSQGQRDEWAKIKGRLIDLAFDEPISQLVYFAAQKVEKLNKSINREALEEINHLVLESQLIGGAQEFGEGIAEKLAPIDLLATSILVQALQKYGQNERSLFTFLNSNERDAIQRFALDYPNQVFSVDRVFDYLVNHLGTELEDSSTNPHRSQWKSILVALERAETIFGDAYEGAAKVLKLIGLVNIFGKPAGVLDSIFIELYANNAQGVESPNQILRELERRQIVRYANYRNKYNFIDGTDLNIEEALHDATNHVEVSEAIEHRLAEFLNLPIIPAKRAQYETGTPRFFEYRILVPEQRLEDPIGEIDGFIHIAIERRGLRGQIKSLSAGLKPHLFVLFKRRTELQELIYNIDRYDFLIKKHSLDKVAQRILQEERDAIADKLNSLLSSDVFERAQAIWYHNGEEVDISSKGELNRMLSEICKLAYPETPVYRNELVNREYLSSPILTARKALINDLLENGNLLDLGYPANKFPPQKTIFWSLLKAVHQPGSSELFTAFTSDSGLFSLWSASEDFLAKTVHQKRTISELYDALCLAPIKAKRGIVEFWVPLYLVMKKEDIAIFHVDNGYVPYLSADILDLIHKKPSNYQIRRYQIDGPKLQLLNQLKEVTQVEGQTSQSTLINIFRQFVVFYRNLPEYSRRTGLLNQYTLAFRTAIEKAKDPASAMFEEFPRALGMVQFDGSNSESILQFEARIREAIRELRTAYDNLLDRIENSILLAFDIKHVSSLTELQERIQERLDGLNTAALPQRLKVFCNRLKLPMEDRASYIKAAADAVLGKSIEAIKDEEESQFMYDLASAVDDLLSYKELANLSLSDKQEGIQLKVVSSNGTSKKETIVIDRGQLAKAKELEISLSNYSREERKKILIVLLNKELGHE